MTYLLTSTLLFSGVTTDKTTGGFYPSHHEATAHVPPTASPQAQLAKEMLQGTRVGEGARHACAGKALDGFWSAGGVSVVLHARVRAAVVHVETKPDPVRSLCQLGLEGRDIGGVVKGGVLWLAQLAQGLLVDVSEANDREVKVGDARLLDQLAHRAEVAVGTAVVLPVGDDDDLCDDVVVTALTIGLHKVGRGGLEGMLHAIPERGHALGVLADVVLVLGKVDLAGAHGLVQVAHAGSKRAARVVVVVVHGGLVQVLQRVDGGAGGLAAHGRRDVHRNREEELATVAFDLKRFHVVAGIPHAALDRVAW
eukprot:m.513308 g.513308  ORF g.513308 m.513308 type:complete len:310 (+) comp109369_c0_seq1:67-996(+)